MALDDNLVAYWKLDETSGVRADSVGTSALTENNTVGSVAGKVGNAGSFSTSYLSCADNPAVSAGDVDFTFVCWINAAVFGSYPVPASKGWGTGQAEWVIYYDGSRVVFNVSDSSGGGLAVNANSVGALSLGTWYFVVIWHDSVNDLIGIQVNNLAPDTVTWSPGVRDGTAPFCIGSSPAQSLYWNGLIDEAGFWKRVLTPEERTELYNGGAGVTYPFALPEPAVSAHGAGMEQYRQHLREQAIALDDEEILLILSKAFGVIQ